MWGEGIGRWAAVLLVAWLTLCWPPAARAQAGTIGRPIATCIRPVAAGDDAAALLAAPSGFDCATDQRRFGPGDYWAVSTPLATAAGIPVRVRIASLWQRSATLWARYADGSFSMLPGDSVATAGRLQLGAIVEYRLPARAAPLVRLLWRVEGSANVRGILVEPRLANPAESAASNLVLTALYAAFGGLATALLIYNLALWGALRHRFQLYYCLMVAALLVYAFSSSGAFAWAWPAVANNDRLRLNYVSLALAAVAATAFARSFFEPAVFAGWMGRAVTLVMVLLTGSALAFAIGSVWQPHLLDRIYAASFACQLVVAAAMLIRAWRVRSNYLWLFGLAWASPIGFATLRILSNTGVIGWSFLLDNSTLVAMAIEALFSSLAIAYRIRLLSRERDQAREQEMAARLLADTDPLTGLLNRRAFLTQAIGRAGDQCLLILDIDHFKRVNETIGHDGGDEVLRVVARALRAAVPPAALVARIGGEEFGVLSAADAPVGASVLLDALRSQRMPFDIAVTASVGSCSGPLAREVDWKALYRRADQALFAAKAAGRDRARDGGHLAAA